MGAPGKILFLMHAHLPFVRHPEFKRFFEENWLFEAIAETYLPLVQAMRRLLEKGVPGTLNLSVSPPLIEMLSDENLIEKFSEHLKKQLELIERMEDRGEVFVIRPERPLEVGRICEDVEKLERLYEEGFQLGEKFILSAGLA